MTIFHYIALACFILFAVADHVGRRTAFPDVRYWRTMGIVSFVLYFVIATFAPFMWDSFLGSHQLIDGSALPLWAQVVTGFLILEFGIYFWHRTMHKVDLIWRFTHQMHHATERPDIWGAYYFHPVDMLGWALLGSLCLVWIFGLSPEAALIIGVVATIPGMFQHANIRTPHWVGYILQRPESHLIHHERASTLTITATSPCPTCCSAPSATRANGKGKTASTTARRTGFPNCWPSGRFPEPPAFARRGDAGRLTP